MIGYVGDVSVSYHSYSPLQLRLVYEWDMDGRYPFDSLLQLRLGYE